MGVFILPFIVAMQILPAVRPSVGTRSAVLQGPLFGVHVSSLLFAYASFALACVIGITYMLQFKEIKAKHLGFFYARLPSLQVLDSMNHRAAVVGWVFLTVGLIVGFVWAAQAPGYDPRVQAMSLQDPKISVALVCWAVYSFEVFAARRIGWGGRRAAYLSALAFAIVLLNFVPVSYFLTKSHNF
jgi:ABC-type transport system involved in cytochrome c biogenesis permease subunit